MKKIFGILFFLPLFSYCQTTWSGDVANILYKNCTSCHHNGGIAPFSLMNYSEALSYSTDIEDVINSNTMPPWPPDPSYSHFANERLLTAQERTDILDWIAQGAQSGDTSLAPPAPVYTGLAEITNPDLISRMPNYTVNTVDDLYRCFVIPSNLATDQYITEIEALPGNRGIVHHILIFEDSTSQPATLDAQDPGPGYTNFGGTGSFASKLIGVWVPGQQVNRMPAGMGIKLPAHTNIVLQIHYPGGTMAQTDSTQIRFKLSSTPLREIAINPPLNHYQLDNGPLFIPANTTRTFTAHYTLPFDVSVLAVGPHMHLIGRSITSYGVTTSNDTIPFIHIPEWDFHWQGTYSFPRVLHLTAGTTIYSSAFYDNTTANPENPNHPPQNVMLGEATTDEMMLVYFAYTSYQAGDENIVQDSSILLNTSQFESADIVSSPQLYSPYPNPSSGQMHADFYLPAQEVLSLYMTDMSGRTVWLSGEEKTWSAGYHSVTIPETKLARGVYYLNLRTKKINRTKQIIID